MTVIYLVTLKFRVYPLSLSLSNPNELSQEPFTLDGPLAFAEYYKKRLSNNADWRIQYLEDILITKELEWESNIRSSYLLPATLQGKKLTITTPMGFEAVFALDTKASYKLSQKQHAKRWESSQILLRLGRRDDIIKMESLRNSLGITLTRKTKLPSSLSQSGPYKAIDYTVKLYTPNLMWASVVSGISQKKLEELLSILRKFGIGKKRNMGWGDLLEYRIYPLKSGTTITPDYILHVHENSKFLEMWRPVSPEKIAELIKGPQRVTQYRKFSLLDSKIGYGAEKPPYWRRHLVIKSALFQVS
ncbi:hypothetical protein [Thermococcus sp. GR6]|uniref:hypothetical protein n=1 Tax=Thermococcus sp. GR6 TaxID=1638256 RepID=UPI001430AABD|nr:hypothetical protein [Thermococcus sp. GR6]NJE42476.1 hypothetical protein [Thermococcus sp. GR6]